MKQRLMTRQESKDVPPDSWTQVCVLPYGMVLFDPTPTELEIIELYGAELRRQSNVAVS